MIFSSQPHFSVLKTLTSRIFLSGSFLIFRYRYWSVRRCHTSPKYRYDTYRKRQSIKTTRLRPERRRVTRCQEGGHRRKGKTEEPEIEARRETLRASFSQDRRAAAAQKKSPAARSQKACIFGAALRLFISSSQYNTRCSTLSSALFDTQQRTDTLIPANVILGVHTGSI